MGIKHVGLVLVVAALLGACGSDGGETMASTDPVVPGTTTPGMMAVGGDNVAGPTEQLPTVPDTTTTVEPAAAVDAGSSAPPVGGAPDCGQPLADGVMLGQGACTNDADVCIVGVDPWADTYAGIINDNTGLTGPEVAGVAADLDAAGVSATCKACWTTQLECATDQIIMDLVTCVPACMGDPAGDICLGCQAPCLPAFTDCSGLDLPM